VDEFVVWKRFGITLASDGYIARRFEIFMRIRQRGVETSSKALVQIEYTPNKQ